MANDNLKCHFAYHAKIKRGNLDYIFSSITNHTHRNMSTDCASEYGISMKGQLKN